MQRIGKYHVLSQIGAGGNGQLFHAHDASIPRDVAIKVLHRPNDQESLARFRREAGALGRLQHPNIVTVYESGVHDGLPYLAMELLAGEDLTKKVAGGLALWEAMNIMQQVALGLHYAHKHGVVHRDVSPANIRLLPDGSVKLLDFGLAGDLGPAAEGTNSGQGGVYLYRAPEHFDNVKPDQRADIFAYGIIYYQLVTGQHPFAGETEQVVACNISMKEPPPISEAAPDCPEALCRILNRLLAKDPELRYQSLEDVYIDVQPLLAAMKADRAEEAIRQARQYAEASQLDAANSALREALELNPHNLAARQLRQTIQERQRREMVLAKVNAAIGEALEKLAQRQFSDAIQKLEAARRLDPDDPRIVACLQSAHDVWKLRRQVLVRLRNAQEQLRCGELEAALQEADEAVSLDAGDVEASALLQTIRLEIHQRSQARLRERLTAVHEMAAGECFDEAFAELALIDREWPNTEDVAIAVRETSAAKQQQERRRERLRAGLEAGRQLARESQHAKAVQALEALASEFPESVEAQTLLRECREAREEHERSVIVTSTARDVWRHAAFGEYEQAYELLQTVLRFYPGEETCMRMLARIEQARAEQQRTAPAAKTVRCPACGTELPGGAKFCDRCGAKRN